MHIISNDTNTALVTDNQKIKWNNIDNKEFYDTIKAEELKNFAIKGGLANGCDMKALTPYWSKAKTILEVGAGYGRVINYLIQHKFQGEITAIERSKELFQHLQKKFFNYPNVNLLHTDIKNLENYNHHFDLILFMWSGIADFSQYEQFCIIKTLAELLEDKGTLVIDTLSMNITPLEVEQLGEQSYLLRLDDLCKYIYEPNTSEIENYAKTAGFINSKRITYRTDTLRERWLYILG